MPYIKVTPNPSGAYPGPQSSSGPGLVEIPEALSVTLLAYNGFVTLTIEDGMVTAVAPDLDAWEAWKASLPEPAEPEPTPQEDADALLVDHEYRLTLLELGVTEGV